MTIYEHSNLFVRVSVILEVCMKLHTTIQWGNIIVYEYVLIFQEDLHSKKSVIQPNSAHGVVPTIQLLSYYICNI